jgi:hypothetical protein
LEIEGFNDLSRTTFKNGDNIKHDLQARHHPHKDHHPSHNSYPDPRSDIPNQHDTPGKSTRHAYDEKSAATAHDLQAGKHKIVPGPIASADIDVKVGPKFVTRNQGHSEVNKGAKNIAGEVWPEKGLQGLGTEVGKAGKVGQITGNGLNEVS